MTKYQISIKGTRQPEVVVGEFTSPFDVEGLLYLTMIEVNTYMKQHTQFLKELGKERNIFVYYLLGKKDLYYQKSLMNVDYFKDILELMRLSNDYLLHEVDKFFNESWNKDLLDKLYQRLIEQSEVRPLDNNNQESITHLRNLAFECITTYRWTASEPFSYVLKVGTLKTLYPNNFFLEDLYLYALIHTIQTLHTLDFKCYVYFKRHNSYLQLI